MGKDRTSYTFCEADSETVKLWWAFVADRPADQLSKLFEWCTNYPAMPVTTWKFRIQLVEDPVKLPTVKLCMTDDQGIRNDGVPEPVMYLPPYEDKEVLSAKMSMAAWEKGASAAMTLV